MKENLLITKLNANDWRFISMLGLVDTVYIVGGGHVGQALAELLVRLSFRPVVIDDRVQPSATR